MTTAGPITLGSLGHEAQVAVRAVSEAMQVARSLEGRVTAAAAKADTSPVTVADLAIQALIARRLADDFQNDPVLAEEDASWLRGEPAAALSAQVVSIVRHVVFDACNEQLIHWIDRGGGKANSRFWTLDPIDGTKGSDLAGRPLDFTAGRRLLRNEGFLASNDLLHEVALRAIRHAMA